MILLFTESEALSLLVFVSSFQLLVDSC
jgi:hypothetical protein